MTRVRQRLTLKLSCLGLFALVAAASARADVSLFGGGACFEALSRCRGIAFEAVYTNEIWGNVDGGLARGHEYIDNMDVTMAVDANGDAFKDAQREPEKPPRTMRSILNSPIIPRYCRGWFCTRTFNTSSIPAPAPTAT